MIGHSFISRFKSFLLPHLSAARLAQSCCMGIYIAFSPFIGFHTIMALVLSWLCNLHLALVLAVSIGINNPWTCLPIYMLDHIVGDYLLMLLGLDSLDLNPVWLTNCNLMLYSYTGLPAISLWAFMIGGNLIGLAIGVMLYPLLLYCFTHYKRMQLHNN